MELELKDGIACVLKRQGERSKESSLRETMVGFPPERSFSRPAKE